MDIRVKEVAPVENLVSFHGFPQSTEMVFVPLFYQPGDHNKTVTIIAQRPRDAEFVIRLPARG